MELSGAGWRWMEVGARFSNTRPFYIYSRKNFSVKIVSHV